MRMLLRFSIAVLTLTIGVACSSLSSYLNAPDPVIPRSDEIAPTNPVRTSCFPGASIEILTRVSVDMPGRTSHYFPAGLFGPNEWSDDFRAGWYSKHLVAMHEPSLLMDDNAGGERYRFLWLRTFHHPVVIRAERFGNQRFLIAKELNGAGGYEPGKLIVNTIRPLAEGEWARLVSLIDHACFWQLPTEQELGGPDGAQWILEGQLDGRYHVVDRWSPRSGSYRELCTYLLQISELGIDLASEEVY
jgi:hypothetical protein